MSELGGSLSSELAPWVQAIGSVLALAAAYLLGRVEKQNKQRAFAMTGWLLANDCFTCLNNVLNRRFFEDENSPGFFSRLAADVRGLTNSIDAMMQFPIHELKSDVVRDFHLLRTATNRIHSIIEPRTANMASLDLEDVPEIIADIQYANQAMTRLKNGLGLNRRAALKEERERELKVAEWRDRIYQALEDYLAKQPDARANLAAVRRERDNGWPNAKGLRRRARG